MTNKSTNGIIYLVIAASAFGSMGAIIRILNGFYSPLEQIILRLIVSALLTLLLCLITKSAFRLKQSQDYFVIILMGVVGYGIQLITYTYSFLHTTIGNASFLFSSFPILTAILALIFLHEKITKKLAIAMVLFLFTLILLFNPAHITTNIAGNLLALGSALCFAIYSVGSGYLSKHGNSPATITFYSVLLAILTCIASMAISHSPFTHPFISWQVMAIIFGFGVLNFIAWNFTNKGFAYISPSIGTMILLLEPVIGATLGYSIFHEIPTLVFIIGAAEMILAIYIATTTL